MMSDIKVNGVWVSNRPLDGNEGANGDAVIEIRLPFGLRKLARYELIEEGNNSYREWCVPAALLNRHAKLRIIDDAM